MDSQFSWPALWGHSHDDAGTAAWMVSVAIFGKACSAPATLVMSAVASLMAEMQGMEARRKERQTRRSSRKQEGGRNENIRMTKSSGRSPSPAL